MKAYVPLQKSRKLMVSLLAVSQARESRRSSGLEVHREEAKDLLLTDTDWLGVASLLRKTGLSSIISYHLILLHVLDDQ